MKLFVCFLVFIAAVRCEMFSSTDELATLGSDQEAVIEEIESLVENLESETRKIKNKLASMKFEHFNMMKNPQKYVEVPLNSFIIIKLLSFDVENIQKNLNETLQNFNLNVKNHQLPMSDFKGVIEGLIRLQKNYELKCEDLSDGIIDGVKYRDKLSSETLYALGSGMSDLNEEFAECFLKIAIERAEDSQKLEIYQNLFEIYTTAENHGKSLEIIEKMIEIEPDNEDLENMGVEIELNLLFSEKKTNLIFDEALKKAELSGTHKTSIKEQKILSQSCMGKRLQNSTVASKLFCRYHSTNSFTKIAPFKLEIANNQPFVGIFHDVISESEIDIFKALTKPKLHRAEVMSHNSKNIVSFNRVAKLGFLYEFQDKTKILAKVSARVSDMSGLSVKTSEEWQVQNYGIGGHYNLHHDFTFKGQDFNLGTGNRILTALFYLSNVEKGGATVFPFLRIYVPPKKGSAVVWHNLSTSGDREYLTLHGACPVLTGSKWVANKWLHEIGQEFMRPCELQQRPTEEDHDRKYWIL